MKHEVDPTQHTFYRTSKRPFNQIQSYHAGVFDDGQRTFDILLLGGTEVKHIKRSGIIPISDITDPDTQLQQTELAPATTKDEKLVGFVQDTPVAREILDEGKFTEEKPSYRVVPDPVASLMF